MLTPPKYSLDSSVIINPWNRRYPRDVFPGFWRDFEHLIDEGLAVCVEEVQREIDQKADQIQDWMRSRSSLVVPFDAHIESSYRQVVNRFRTYAKRTQRRNQADPMIVALAMSQGLTVVTDEVSDPPADPPKIPNLCKAFNVPCLSLVELMRAEGWKYG